MHLKHKWFNKPFCTWDRQTNEVMICSNFETAVLAGKECGRQSFHTTPLRIISMYLYQKNNIFSLLITTKAELGCLQNSTAIFKITVHKSKLCLLSLTWAKTVCRKRLLQTTPVYPLNCKIIANCWPMENFRYRKVFTVFSAPLSPFHHLCTILELANLLICL